MPGSVESSEADAASSSQSVRAQVRLRELIVGGELLPGTRIPELSLVERLGVSRTPVRTALLRLQEEGLLEMLSGGGFVVREFSEIDIQDAIEMRGTLEGLAARLAAERGAPAMVLADAKNCLARIDDDLTNLPFGEELVAAYTECNARFHQLLADMSGSDVIMRQIDRVMGLPFASPNVVGGAGARSRDSLVIAQSQHRAVIDAIELREGARAESVMREHAHIARDNLRTAMASHLDGQSMTGAHLIRRSPRRALRWG